MRNARGKTLVPLLGVAAILAMGVASFAIVLQIKERDKRVAKERELQGALAQLEGLKTQFDELQQSKVSIEDELARARRELTDSQDQLAQAVQAEETLKTSVEDREQEIARLTKDLEQTRGQQEKLTGQVTELQSERDALKQQLAELERAKGELESKVMELSDRPTVELDKVVVSGEPGAGGAAAMPVSAMAGSASSGQVVVVNREYDFIVMNIGKNHGLAIGQEFKVVRGSETLGKVKVEKVYDELSAAAILPESKKDSIREGDAVVAL